MEELQRILENCWISPHQRDRILALFADKSRGELEELCCQEEIRIKALQEALRSSLTCLMASDAPEVIIARLRAILEDSEK